MYPVTNQNLKTYCTEKGLKVIDTRPKKVAMYLEVHVHSIPIHVQL